MSSDRPLSTRSYILIAAAAVLWAVEIATVVALEVTIGLSAEPLHLLFVAVVLIVSAAAVNSANHDRVQSSIDQLRAALRTPTGAWPTVADGSAEVHQIGRRLRRRLDGS